jgi:hypothetical protein
MEKDSTMRTIKGFTLPCVLKKAFSSMLPADLEILTVMVTRGQPVLYGLTDPAATDEKRDRIFRIYGLGEDIHEKQGLYIGSFIINGKVPLHLFELEEPPKPFALIKP